MVGQIDDLYLQSHIVNYQASFYSSSNYHNDILLIHLNIQLKVNFYSFYLKSKEKQKIKSLTSMIS